MGLACTKPSKADGDSAGALAASKHSPKNLKPPHKKVKTVDQKSAADIYKAKHKEKVKKGKSKAEGDEIQAPEPVLQQREPSPSEDGLRLQHVEGMYESSSSTYKPTLSPSHAPSCAAEFCLEDGVETYHADHKSQASTT